MSHVSGFVNLLGLPNAGKSTLTNALTGYNLSITNRKPQTTRHRILSIVSDEAYQIIFSDVPGYIDEPAYELQENMNQLVKSSFDDADLLILVHDVTDDRVISDDILTKIKLAEIPKILVLNKIDLKSKEELDTIRSQWSEQNIFDAVYSVSALKKTGVTDLLSRIISYLPEGPVYYPKDYLSDRSDRFFVSELIREKVLSQYKEEIPYSVEVSIESFTDTKTNKGEKLARIGAYIYVMRESQKGIILGKGGQSIKTLGTTSRKSIEKYLGKKVFLDLTIKVRSNWRNDKQFLKKSGYQYS